MRAYLNTLLEEMPNGRNFRVLGYGCIVKNDYYNSMQHNDYEHGSEERYDDRQYENTVENDQNKSDFTRRGHGGRCRPRMS
jgi:hypothetical protein